MWHRNNWRKILFLWKTLRRETKVEMECKQNWRDGEKKRSELTFILTDKHHKKSSVVRFCVYLNFIHWNCVHLLSWIHLVSYLELQSRLSDKNSRYHLAKRWVCLTIILRIYGPFHGFNWISEKTWNFFASFSSISGLCALVCSHSLLKWFIKLTLIVDWVWKRAI